MSENDIDRLHRAELQMQNRLRALWSVGVKRVPAARFVLVALGKECPRCSIAYIDPGMLESCADLGQDCWHGCPLCYPTDFLEVARGYNAVRYRTTSYYESVDRSSQ